jgi:hypothetical protein
MFIVTGLERGVFTTRQFSRLLIEHVKGLKKKLQKIKTSEICYKTHLTKTEIQR